MKKAVNPRNTGKYRSAVLEDANAEDQNIVIRRRVAELRKEKKLSQKEVSEILGISQRTYCMYERGEARVPVDRLAILAQLYNVSMDYLSGIIDKVEKCPARKSTHRRKADAGTSKAVARE